jgi:cobalt/nickel transport system permease protein
MHIPDGYLSPSTCAGLYVAATPFWYGALRQVRKSLHTQTIPLLSVLAAFCFVLMMFNLPLPGGTTAHAVGMGVTAIILGPWASIAAISLALLIQAIFFGDGGITAIGANCFNMAIVGSLVAYGVYRLFCRGARIGSTRRVFGAGLAGYTAINASALCAAIEFGLQPMFFRDATGAPLYAPYPLHIAIPAMLAGHLTFAGLAEFAITSGVVAWLQRAEPSLLRTTAPDAPDAESPAIPVHDRDLWPFVRRLWIAIAILLMLTPLGILAVGSAWGEWSPQDFSDAQTRQQIASASGNAAPPPHAPAGLARLSALWTAPLSRYAPSFIRGATFGYLASAMMGVGLIIVLALVLRVILARFPARSRSRTGFIAQTTRSLVRTVQRALFAEEVARSQGFLQGQDARVNVAGLGALIIAAVAVRRLEVLLALFAIAVVVAILSRVSLVFLATRVWIAVLIFTGAIAVPAIFLSPGTVLLRVPALGWPITWQGLRGASFLILRAETAATFSVLLVLCTLWTQLLRALRFYRLPAAAAFLLGMTWRYIFLLLTSAEDMFEAREARLVGTLDGPDRRRLAAATAGVLLDKSLQLSRDVHSAMEARGFRGELRLLDEPPLSTQGWLRLGTLVTLAGAVVWLGR